MNMEKCHHIRINKNRGWRGLAEVECYDEARNLIGNMIFSFSQPMWNDLLDGYIVMQDDEYYYVIQFENTERLPKRDQQRSVLITDFIGSVSRVNRYEKARWMTSSGKDYAILHHFTHNTNNHTTSDWNCIGIRVVPEI